MTCERSAYYNEIDPYCCAWLQNLMDRGLITRGRIDDRSIADVRPDDVRGYQRVHFFAGIAGWDHALDLAGWGDGVVWTGSAPCQPFSSAGKRAGGNDERHLWPHWFDLISKCRPPSVVGEQVASAVGWGWLDAVCADLEAEGYATGAVVLGAHSVGAPHIRQRLWWVGIAGDHGGTQVETCADELAGQRAPFRRWPVEFAEPRAAGGNGGRDGAPRTAGRRHGGDAGAARGDGMALAAGAGRDALALGPAAAVHGEALQPGRLCDTGIVADADGGNTGPERQQRGRKQRLVPENRRSVSVANTDPSGQRFIGSGDLFDGERLALGYDADRRGAQHWRPEWDHTHGHGVARDRVMGDPDEPRPQGRRLDLGEHADQRAAGTAGAWDLLVWLPCTDGKARPTQPGLFPLADGVSGRVGRLRAYGNAIVPQVAAAFIKAVIS